MVTGLALLLVGLPWTHPEAGPGAPAWWTWSIGLPVALAFVWLDLLLAAGLRAMVRHRKAPGGRQAAAS